MLDEPDIPQAECEPDELLEDVVLCAHCMANNRPIDEFCHECGMPIGQYVWNQPLQGVLAQGWVYRRASTGYVSPIVFWGMCAAFGPVVVLSVLIGIGIPRDLFFQIYLSSGFGPGVSHSLEPLTGAFSLLFWMCITGLYIWLLFRVTRNYLRYRNTELDE